MKVPEIRVTNDYELFKFHSQNRKAGSNKGVKKSIQEIDLTPYVPIIVDRDFYVADGQNRLLACKSLGLPVFYVVLDEKINTDSAIIALNRDQRSWRQTEFLHFWATTKGGCYKELEDFEAKHKLGISNSIAIFPENQINASIIRKGKATFVKSKQAEDIAAFLKTEEIKALSYTHTRPFVLAIRKAFEEFSDKELKRIQRNMIRVVPAAKWWQYTDQFKNILNK